MNRGWVGAFLCLALMSGGRRARACTPVKALTPAEILSPVPNSRLGVDDAFFFQTREANPAVIAAGFAVSIPLELVAAFEPFRPFESRLAFFKPSLPLEPERFYALEAQSSDVIVPFYATATKPRFRATLSVSVVSRVVPEDVLSTASCYTGPLADRPFTRVADVTVTARTPARFLVSVTTLDSVSGELIEDVALRSEGAGEAVGHIELPLPEGVADCLRVRVVDDAGAVVVDEGSFCATPEGETRTQSVHLFMPLQAPPGGLDSEPGFEAPRPVDEPSAAPGGGEPASAPGEVSRTSKGCEVSARAEGGASGAGIFALGWLLLGRRRSAR